MAAGGPGGATRPAMLVETGRAQPVEFDSLLEVVGDLQAKAYVEVMSKVNGRLEQVTVYRGDSVRSGQLLAQLDDDDLAQQIRRSEASIAVARAARAREEATLENLRIQLRRLARLHDENLIAIQELEDLQSRVQVAESQVQLVMAQVDQAEAALQELKIQQEQTSVYSPLDATVGTRHLEPGALVNPGVAIVSLLDLSVVKTVVPVPERLLERIRIGMQAEISVDAYPNKTYSGTIARISPFLNSDTRTAEIEIEVPNPQGLLKPGMFARVGIDANLSRRVLAIQRSALLTRGSLKGVFLLDDDSRTVFRPVEIGRIQGDFVEIRDGLEEGVVVVTRGAQNLNYGDQVRVGQTP